MKCPNCKMEFNYGDRCPRCKIDTALYKRTLNISNSHYNYGLERVKIHDLSGAVSALDKSIEFNKANVNARNLLGLVYFEMGRIGDAVKQWVLSSSFLKNDNLAIYYLDILQKNAKASDKLNEAVLAYNTALQYMEQESEDLALIQLKRALELNPKFIDVMNLLSLCHLTRNERDKAKQLIERVLEMDSGNAYAHRYFLEAFGRLWSDKQLPKQGVGRYDMQRLAGGAEQTALERGMKQYSGIAGGISTGLSAADDKSFRDYFHIPEIICFVVGVICMAAVFYILVLPGEIEKRDALLENINETMTQNEQSYNDALARYNAVIVELTSENDELKSRIDGLEANKSVLDRIQKVSQLETVYAEGNIDEAIALLSAIDPTGMPTDVVERYNTVKAQAYPSYARQMYDAGIASYNAENYNEARHEFEVCLKYDEKTIGISDQALYMLALMADNAENFDMAKEFYQTILDEYPGSSRINTVKNRLNALQ